MKSAPPPLPPKNPTSAAPPLPPKNGSVKESSAPPLPNRTTQTPSSTSTTSNVPSVPVKASSFIQPSSTSSTSSAPPPRPPKNTTATAATKYTTMKSTKSDWESTAKPSSYDSLSAIKDFGATSRGARSVSVGDETDHARIREQYRTEPYRSASSTVKKPIITGDKNEYLCIQEGAFFVAWNRRWFVVANGNLSIYPFQEDTKVLHIIPLSEIVLVEEAPYLKRPNAFHIEQTGKKHFYVQAENDKQLNDWLDYFKKICPSAKFPSSQKTQPLTISAPKTTEEKKEKPVVTPTAVIPTMPANPTPAPSTTAATEPKDGKKKISEEQKREEEYIRQKHILQKNPGMVAAKVERAVNLSGARCTAEVVAAETKEHPTKKKELFVQYKIDVRLDTVDGLKEYWTIFRRYNQFFEVAQKLTECGIRPRNEFPGKTSTRIFTPEFVEERRQMLQKWLREVSQDFWDTTLSNKVSYFYFAKFLAPVQMGDEKSSNFIMPFKLDPV